MVFSGVSRLLQLTTITKYYIIKFEINFKELVISWKTLKNHAHFLVCSWPEKHGWMGLLAIFVHIIYMLNFAKRTFWGWWDKWDDTALQTQDSKVELRWSEAEHGLSVTEVPHNIKYVQGSEELTLCLFETWIPEGGRTRDLDSHHRGYNDPFIALVVSLYSHQSYRLKCFMTTPQCWNQLKTLW